MSKTNVFAPATRTLNLGNGVTRTTKASPPKVVDSSEVNVRADDQLAELAKLRAENEKLKAKVASKSHLSLKVSEKGAVSLYGVRRFPVTFYLAEWERILAHASKINDFMQANLDRLSVKGEE